MRVGTRYTVYDAMEERGVFAQNPANASSKTYKRADWPKMLYHPKGAERVVFPGTQEITPWGERRMVGEQREIVNKVVETQEEYDALVRQGWHKHPADAIRASGRVAPATVTAERISDIDQQIARLQEEKKRGEEALLAQKLAEPDEDAA